MVIDRPPPQARHHADDTTTSLDAVLRNGKFAPYTPMTIYSSWRSPGFWQNPAGLSSVYFFVRRAEWSLVGLHHFIRQPALAVNNQCSVVTILSTSRRSGAGDAGHGDQRRGAQPGMPTSITGSLQRHPEAFAASSRATLLIGGLAAVYIVLGCSTKAIHPSRSFPTLRPPGSGALLALLITHTEMSLIAVIGIILLIGL